MYVLVTALRGHSDDNREGGGGTTKGHKDFFCFLKFSQVKFSEQASKDTFYLIRVRKVPKKCDVYFKWCLTSFGFTSSFSFLFSSVYTFQFFRSLQGSTNRFTEFMTYRSSSYQTSIFFIFRYLLLSFLTLYQKKIIDKFISKTVSIL
jgi:hypothetical protein